ncbi:MAG: DUF1810 domain-containing protein [Proteobacteria bacterium]|nr:DUF1810 domain-containing protein [Pseudomonadota bacterium]
MDDPYDLQRFVRAQEPVYRDVLAELGAGRKTSHWMWFIFPQLAALGRSGTAKFYGIASRDEAVAYWKHAVLGPRLKECAGLVLAAAVRKSAHDIFGSPDDLKLRSSMTLFGAVAADEPVFGRVLDACHAGQPDPQTLALL